MFENKEFQVTLINTKTGEFWAMLVKAVDQHEAREFVRKDLTKTENVIGLVHEATA